MIFLYSSSCHVLLHGTHPQFRVMQILKVILSLDFKSDADFETYPHFRVMQILKLILSVE